MSRLITNPVPRFDSIQKLEWFLLTAVTTILVIRTQLWLTHYPQLGGDGLHIAHLLYGGIFMVIALWFGLIYLNRWSRAVTAIVGGIGFGFFIDELGKFITSDNNYFFKPAAGLIYVIFVVMFLIIRELSRRQSLNPRTALANALSLLPGTAVGEYRQEDAQRAKRLLGMADQKDASVAIARQIFDEASVTPSRAPSKLTRLAGRIHAWIKLQTERPHFTKFVIAIVILWGISSVSSVIAIDINSDGVDSSSGNPVDQGVVGSLESISVLFSFAFVLVGSWSMWKGNRNKAYRYFGRALLVSIFVTRVFVFVESQFAAVFGLALDLILFAAISEIASQEEEVEFRFAGMGQADLTGDNTVPEKP